MDPDPPSEKGSESIKLQNTDRIWIRIPNSVQKTSFKKNGKNLMTMLLEILRLHNTSLMKTQSHLEELPSDPEDLPGGGGVESAHKYVGVNPDHHAR